MANDEKPMFRVTLPDGRVARLPREVLEQYVSPGLQAIHCPDSDDVEGHHLITDAKSGSSTFHTDWEMGICEIQTNHGPTCTTAWHRHPFGTEYAEISS